MERSAKPAPCHSYVRKRTDSRNSVRLNGPLVSVLIIEDDPSIATLIESVCKVSFLACERVRDGSAAIDRLRSTRYEAVILDLMIPRFNGFEVLAFLRAEQPHMLRRVIIITAMSAKTLAAFDASEVCCLLHKPFDVADLQDALTRATSIEQ